MYHIEQAQKSLSYISFYSFSYLYNLHFAMKRQPNNTLDTPRRDNHLRVGRWHSEWQSKFNRRKVSHGNHRYDVQLNSKIFVEFQHSYIKSSDIKSRCTEAKNNNMKVEWILDGNTCKVERVSDSQKSYFITFGGTPWVIGKFVEAKVSVIFLDTCSGVFQIPLNQLSGKNVIEVNHPEPHQEFLAPVDYLRLRCHRIASWFNACRIITNKK